MEYQVTLYTQAQVTLTIKNPADAEDAAVRAIQRATTGLPAHVPTWVTNHVKGEGAPVVLHIESGNWRVLKVIDENGDEVV